MIKLHREDCMIMPHKPLIDGSKRLKSVTITKRELNLRIAIYDALWIKKMAHDIDFCHEKLPQLYIEVDKLVSMFWERGLRPTNQNIEYFVKNCI